MYFLCHINGAFSRSLGYNGGMPAELDEATPLRPQYREKISPYFRMEMGTQKHPLRRKQCPTERR